MHEAYWLSGDQGGTDRHAKSRITWVYRIIHKTWQWSRTVCAGTKHFVLIWNPHHWQLDANRKNQSTYYKMMNRITMSKSESLGLILIWLQIVCLHLLGLWWILLHKTTWTASNGINWTNGIRWHQTTSIGRLKSNDINDINQPNNPLAHN